MSFVFFFERYFFLQGGTIRQLCEHNSSVAKGCGRADLGALWDIVMTMLDQFEEEEQLQVHSQQYSQMESSSTSSGDLKVRKKKKKEIETFFFFKNIYLAHQQENSCSKFICRNFRRR